MPTVLGVLTNEFFPGLVRRLKPVLPLIGVALTTLLCASPCAQVATILRCAPPFPMQPPPSGQPTCPAADSLFQPLAPPLLLPMRGSKDFRCPCTGSHELVFDET